MPRGASKSTPIVENGILYSHVAGSQRITVGSSEWWTWLKLGQTFSLEGCTFRAEKRRIGLFWYAYRRVDGKLYKRYAGLALFMTLESMKSLADHINFLASFEQTS